MLSPQNKKGGRVWYKREYTRARERNQNASHVLSFSFFKIGANHYNKKKKKKKRKERKRWTGLNIRLMKKKNPQYILLYNCPDFPLNFLRSSSSSSSS